MTMRFEKNFDNVRCRQPVTVDWQDCAWFPRISARQPVADLSFSTVSRSNTLRRTFTCPKIMKTNLPSSRRRAGFTLVELLVVIAIIAILAALLLPVISVVETAARKKQALVEEQGIVTAIEHYDSVYGRFPVSSAAQTVAAANASNPDFTYGGYFNNASGVPAPVFSSGYQMTNNEVMAILMDMTTYPNGNPTVNTNHVKNPQQTSFLNATMSGYDPSSGGSPVGGVDKSGVYRDPWGNPYIITMDLNYDGMCKDVIYDLNAVSGGGLNGLINPDGSSATTDNWEYRGKVMVWSAGPDGKVDPTVPANQGVNKDNVLSWQQ